MEKNSEFQFELRDYQEEATKDIKRIYSNKDKNGNAYHDRFAGVVLPTGGGKSFVAIEQLLSFNNDAYNNETLSFDNHFISKDKNERILNNAKMLYVAPTNEIMSQIKLHLVKNVLFKIPNIENMTIAEINQLIKSNFQDLNFSGINFGLNIEEQITDSSSASEKIKAIVKQLSPSQITSLVEDAFPNLKFRCYSGIKGESDLEEVKDSDVTEADFIILDEAHRLGASKWGPRFASNLEKNPKAKVLAITATPERTDSTGQNMMAGIARMVYPGEVLLPEEYMAKEIYVVDAVKNGIVNAPDILNANSALITSEEYRNVREHYDNLIKQIKKSSKEREINKEKAEKLYEIIIKMNKLLGLPERLLTQEEIDEYREKDIQETIAQGVTNKNGKYIVFIENNETQDGEKRTPEQFFLDQIELVKKRFAGVKDENGNPVPLTISFVTGETVRIDENGNPVLDKKSGKKNDNDQVLKDFEDASNTAGGIKVLLSNKILDEGVHVEGIDGEVMFSAINSRTVYLQRVGRCISSLDPSKPFSEQSQTRVIDTAGNTFKQLVKKDIAKTSEKYDAEKLRTIKSWIEEHDGQIPDVNKLPEEPSLEEIEKLGFEKAVLLKRAQAEKEARYALALKRIRTNYYSYKDAKELPIYAEKYIEEIRDIAEKINLWETEIHLRTIEPSEADLTGNGFLEKHSDIQSKFMELYDQSLEEMGKGLVPQKRISKLINVLRVIKLHAPTIKFPQEFFLEVKIESGDSVQSTEDLSLNLMDFLRANLPNEKIQIILQDLQNPGAMKTTSRREMIFPTDEYDLGKELAFVRGKVWTSQHDYSNGKEYFNNYDFEQLIKCGLIEDGFADLKKLNEISRRVKNYYYNITEKDIDSHGRLIKPKSYPALQKTINVGLIEKFEMASLKDGQVHFDEYYIDEKHNSSGYDKYGYDAYGYDRYGYNRLGFNRDNIHKDTRTKYSFRGFYYDQDRRLYVNRETNDEYDALGYNVYGFNSEGFERPVYKKSSLWHRRNIDGTYDSHGEPMKPAFDSIKSHDAHGFTGTIKQEGNPRKFDSKNPTNPEGFYSYGTRRKKPASQTAKNCILDEDYFINGVDIDGFNYYDYKKVNVNGKEIYIHRDTSSIHDKNGLIYDPKKGVPVRDPDIDLAMCTMQAMLFGNMSFEEFASWYAKGKSGVSIESLKKGVDRGFELYQTTCPDAFDEKASIKCKSKGTYMLPKPSSGMNFEGIDTYYFSDSDSTEKAKSLARFFEACPRAREIYVGRGKEAMRKWRILEMIRESRGLSKEEKEDHLPEVVTELKKYTDFDER